MSRPLSFEERKATLESLGWRFHATEKGFTKVFLPLSPRDWCRLCMRTGEANLYLSTGEKDEGGNELFEASEYIGGCCGNMSAVQDQLNSWFRDGGEVDAHEIVDLGEAMRDHGDDTFADDVSDERLRHVVAEVQKGTEPQAWGKIALLYQLVRGHSVREAVRASAPHVTELESAFRLVSHFSFVYGMRDFFTGSQRIEAPMTANANLIMRFAKFLPALGLLHDRAKQLVPEPVEGWALVDLDRGEGEIAENGIGLCIYATRIEAEKILGYFEGREKGPKLKIRAVRVSLDKGIEFLDEGAAPGLKVPRDQFPHWATSAAEDVEIMCEQYVAYYMRGKSDELRREAEAAFTAGAHFFRNLRRS